MLILNIDTNRIERVARVMLGLTPDAPLEQELQAPREVLMQVGRVSFETIFRQFASVVDQFVLQPELLRYSAMDDNFYRNVAMMLHPALFLDMDEASPGVAYARRRLDRMHENERSEIVHPFLWAGGARARNEERAEGARRVNGGARREEEGGARGDARRFVAA